MILNPDYNIQIFTLIDVIQRLGSTFHLVNASRDFHTQLGRFNELLMFYVPNKEKFSTTKKQKKQAKRMKKAALSKANPPPPAANAGTEGGETPA